MQNREIRGTGKEGIRHKSISILVADKAISVF